MRAHLIFWLSLLALLGCRLPNNEYSNYVSVSLEVELKLKETKRYSDLTEEYAQERSMLLEGPEARPNTEYRTVDYLSILSKQNLIQIISNTNNGKKAYFGFYCSEKLSKEQAVQALILEVNKAFNFLEKKLPEYTIKVMIPNHEGPELIEINTNPKEYIEGSLLCQ